MKNSQAVLFFVMAAGAAYAQRGGGGGGNATLPSLKTVPAPQPAGLSQYVQDTNALVVLGKALFWDSQTGSDGRTACATCHFHAGADHRITNTLGMPQSVATA